MTRAYLLALLALSAAWFSVFDEVAGHGEWWRCWALPGRINNAVSLRREPSAREERAIKSWKWHRSCGLLDQGGQDRIGKEMQGYLLFTVHVRSVWFDSSGSFWRLGYSRGSLYSDNNSESMRMLAEGCVCTYCKSNLSNNRWAEVELFSMQINKRVTLMSLSYSVLQDWAWIKHHIDSN